MDPSLGSQVVLPWLPPAGEATGQAPGRLPDSCAGATLTKFNQSNADMPSDPKTTAFLASIGKTPADMSFTVSSGKGGFPLFLALRVKGSNADQMKAMFQLSAQQEAVKTKGMKIETASLDRIGVLKSTDPKTGEVTYVVVRADTALGVLAGTDAAAQKAFGALAK